MVTACGPAGWPSDQLLAEERGLWVLLRWTVSRCIVGVEQTTRTPESMSAPHLPSRVRPQPLMSLSSITTSVTLAATRIASCLAPRRTKLRRITYDALMETLYCALLPALSVAPWPSYTT